MPRRRRRRLLRLPRRLRKRRTLGVGWGGFVGTLHGRIAKHDNCTVTFWKERFDVRW